MTPSRPVKKGTNLTVEPIRKQKNIKSISRLLKSHPRNYLLFILGINNGLRTNDLVRLRYHQVEGLKAKPAKPMCWS